MNKLLFILLSFIYLLLIDYFTKMFIFDFKKYILKDKYLQNMHFSYNWQKIYSEKKADEKFENKQLLKILNNSENVDK